jgi:hypothetical protein
MGSSAIVLTADTMWKQDGETEFFVDFTEALSWAMQAVRRQVDATFPRAIVGKPRVQVHRDSGGGVWLTSIVVIRNPR